MDVLDRADLPFPHSLPEFQRTFSPMMRPAPPTWRKPAGETALPARTAARRDRRRQDRCARIAGNNAIPRHQRRQLVLNHPDRREDGRPVEGELHVERFRVTLDGLGGFHMGNPG